MVVVVVPGVDVVVVGAWVVVVVGVVVVVAGQLGPLPVGGQVSQQLAQVPMVRFFPVHASALFAILQRVPPVLLVRQHVTKPCLPHTECAAHLLTAPLQRGGKLGLVPLDSMRATCATQLT